MLIKTGDGKILDLVDSNDESLDDAKTRVALDEATSAAQKSEENLSKNGNKTDSTMQADSQSDAETK